MYRVRALVPTLFVSRLSASGDTLDRGFTQFLFTSPQLCGLKKDCLFFCPVAVCPKAFVTFGGFYGKFCFCFLRCDPAGAASAVHRAAHPMDLENSFEFCLRICLPVDLKFRIGIYGNILSHQLCQRPDRRLSGAAGNSVSACGAAISVAACRCRQAYS